MVHGPLVTTYIIMKFLIRQGAVWSGSTFLPLCLKLLGVALYDKTWAASWQSLQSGMYAQRRLRSAWTSADLSLRWAHSHLVCFVMRRLTCCSSFRMTTVTFPVLEFLWFLRYILTNRFNFRWDLVMKKQFIILTLPLIQEGQLSEWALSTVKLPRRRVQEQFG